MPDVDLTAELDRIAGRLGGSWEWATVGKTRKEDAPRLLAALRAVLELAGEWDEGGLPMRALNQYRGREQHLAGQAVLRAVRDCADQLREAITREITGKGESDA